MTAAPPRPARFAPGDPVLAGGVPATVSVVYPSDGSGRRRYGIAAWSDDAGEWVEAGVVGEADLAPMVVP